MEKVKVKIVDQETKELWQESGFAGEDGIVEGWIVGNYLLGDILESDPDYILPEFWINLRPEVAVVVE